MNSAKKREIVWGGVADVLFFSPARKKLSSLNFIYFTYKAPRMFNNVPSKNKQKTGAFRPSKTKPSPSNSVLTELAQTPGSAKDKFLGPDYPYYKYIRNPSEIGMSTKGTLNQLGQNVDGLMEYVKLLVSGKSRASATGKPLGNKFFLPTGGKCAAEDNVEPQERFIYINNIPTGNIPIVSAGMDTNFADYKGLIPGAISNLNALNPMEIFQGFTQGSRPACRKVTLQTVDTENRTGSETHYVTTVDIGNLDPCLFTDRKNPVTSKKCKETFRAMGGDDPVPASWWSWMENIDGPHEVGRGDGFSPLEWVSHGRDDEMSSGLAKTNIAKSTDLVEDVYILTIGLFACYLISKVMWKNGMLPA